jgi:hypothetical protein
VPELLVPAPKLPPKPELPTFPDVHLPPSRMSSCMPPKPEMMIPAVPKFAKP